MLQLIGLKEDLVTQRARQLITRARQELNDAAARNILELVETVFIYKFPDLSRQEIEQMLGLSELKHTRVYQEALEEGLEQGLEQGLERGLEQGLERGREEGKLAAVPLLLEAGMSVEQIAVRLNLDLQAVRQAAQEQS